MSAVASRILLIGALLSGLDTLVSCRDQRSATDAGAPPATVTHAATPDHDDLREDSRLILERHCGLCHIHDYPTARPGALAVFDLREPDWSARMSNAQLRNAHWRLGEPLPPDGSLNDVSDEERALFMRFVDAELARRARLNLTLGTWAAPVECFPDARPWTGIPTRADVWPVSP